MTISLYKWLLAVMICQLVIFVLFVNVVNASASVHPEPGLNIQRTGTPDYCCFPFLCSSPPLTPQTISQIAHTQHVLSNRISKATSNPSSPLIRPNPRPPVPPPSPTNSQVIRELQNKVVRLEITIQEINRQIEIRDAIEQAERRETQNDNRTNEDGERIVHQATEY